MSRLPNAAPKPPKREKKARKPIARKTAPKRSRVKHKPRPAKETTRIYGPKAFREWLHQQPCAVSGRRGAIVQAHAKTGGIGYKADWTTTFPLDHALHVEQHDIGVKAFEAKYGVSLFALAADTQKAWRSVPAGETRGEP